MAKAIHHKRRKYIMKRTIAIFMVVVLLVISTTALSAEAPSMQLLVRVSKLTLRTEPSRNSPAVKNQDNKSVQLRIGDVVYEAHERFDSPEYGEFCHIRTADGLEGYVIKRYLTYGYKIILTGQTTENIYTSEWACIHKDLGIGSGAGDRKGEVLIVTDETVNCLHVLTTENIEGVEGYISRYADYDYIYQ